MDIKETNLMKELESRQSPFHSKINEVYGEVEDILNNRIARVFPFYTQHDIKHSLRIIEHIFDVIENVKQLNDLEITLLIYSALLHDIGMAVEEEEIEKIKLGEISYEGLNYNLLLREFSGDETLALQEFIREVHAYRSSEYIKNKLAHHFFIPDMKEVSFANDLARICEAHTKDFFWLKRELDSNVMKGSYSINLKYCAMALRLGDILDFDSSRTPGRLFQSARPLGYSLQEWKQHFVIENAPKVAINKQGMKVIEFYGNCEEPKIYRKVLSYLNWVEIEINNALEISEDSEDKHKFNLHHKVNNFIKSKNYKVVDLKFEFNYLKVMQILMGEELYGNKKSGLREIIQNSIDACNHMKVIRNNNIKPWEEVYKGKIDIILQKGNNEITIRDNGIGMDYSILKRYFLELGSSYYRSKEFKILDNKYKPIGNYGIGFLASFMLSSKILLRTSHYKNNVILELEVEKNDQYVAIKEVERPGNSGTEIVLNYEEFLEIWENDVENLKNYLSNSFLFNDIKVMLYNEKDDQTYEEFEIESNNISGAVDLSNYLIDVKMEIKYSMAYGMNVFKRCLEDVFDEEVLLYEQVELKHLVKETKLEDLIGYIEDEYINATNVILIEDDDVSRLEKTLEVYHDSDEIVEYFWDYSIPNSVLIIPQYRETKMDTTYHYTDSNDIVGFDIEKINALGIEELSHNNEVGTFYTAKKYRIFTQEGIDKFLELKKVDDGDDLLGWIRPKEEPYRKLYIRGVFVKRISVISNENALKDMVIDEIKINILNESIIPTVNRNSIKETDEEIINNSIYIAICLHIIDNTSDESEKTLMRKYLGKYMDFSKSLIKEEYHIKQ
ncbi:ATP-binding protein [Lysinibacillus sphaericus]|uniref:HD domain-containing protein n=1 Tax=Lysinibacillus sphaericus TaxID=1421 RepID=UPI00216173BD|nr:ATP-binding protein [Lysinibacillus sphaericus]MCS1384809.1 ATP-binding protein [Lysinibacillus sphaericus]